MGKNCEFDDWVRDRTTPAERKCIAAYLVRNPSVPRVFLQLRREADTVVCAWLEDGSWRVRASYLGYADPATLVQIGPRSQRLG